jgi:hypothetical protein
MVPKKKLMPKHVELREKLRARFRRMVPDSPEILIQGGLAQNVSYSAKISREILQILPHAKVVQPIGDNLDGASWIAENMLEDAPPLLRWAR